MSPRKLPQSLAIVAVLLIAACGDKSSSTSSTEITSAPISTEATGSTDAPGATDAPPPDTSASAPRDPESIAQAKVQAALSVLPEGWVGTVSNDIGDDSDGSDGSEYLSEGSLIRDSIVFSPCLDAGDYDLDNLDADSAASWQLEVEGPEDPAQIAAASGGLEARVFAEGVDVDKIYAVLEKIIGSDAGRECLAREVPGWLAADAGPDAQFDARVEVTEVQGADVGTRLVVTFTTAGFTGDFFVDLVATHLPDRCTVFGTFVSFGTPFDQALASDMMLAAIAA